MAKPLLLALLLALAAADARAAQCDRFTYWSYPWPQPCHQRLNFYLAHHAAAQRHVAYRVAARVSAPSPFAESDLKKLRDAMTGANK